MRRATSSWLSVRQAPGGRRSREPVERLLGVEERGLGALHAHVGGHELAHLAPDLARSASSAPVSGVPAPGADTSRGSGITVGRRGRHRRVRRGRRTRAPRAASWRRAGWRRARRSRRPRPPPRAPAGWPGPRGRSGCHPWRSGAPGPPGRRSRAASRPYRASIAVMPGKRAGKSAIDRASSQAPPAGHGRRHRPGHDVARRQLAAGIGVEREAPALAIDQQRARAAHRLGDERRRIHARERERGRVELQELDVAKLGADPVCQRPAVGGGHLRIGGDGVELADAARGEHHRAGVDRIARAAPRQRHHAGDPLRRAPAGW